jgi:hypothetical protein
MNASVTQRLELSRSAQAALNQNIDGGVNLFSVVFDYP